MGRARVWCLLACGLAAMLAGRAHRAWGQAEAAPPEAGAPATVTRTTTVTRDGVTTTTTEQYPARVIVVDARPARAALPLRLGLDFGLVHSRGGALPYGDAGAKPRALGLRLAIGAGDVARIHFGIAHEWESEARYAAKGLRLDLVSVGFPIRLLAEPVEIHVEPLMRMARGEILAPQGSDTTFFRIDTGLALLATVAYEKFFFGFEPVVVDFRFFGADTQEARTGFSTLWWLAFVLGREF
jgi:hypothetical protein